MHNIYIYKYAYLYTYKYTHICIYIHTHNHIYIYMHNIKNINHMERPTQIYMMHYISRDKSTLYIYIYPTKMENKIVHCDNH